MGEALLASARVGSWLSGGDSRERMREERGFFFLTHMDTSDWGLYMF